MLRAISHLQRTPVARTAAFSSLRRTSLKAAASAHSKRCGCGNCARSFSVQSQTHYDIPKTQKAIVFEEKGAPIRVRDDHPVVQPDELKPGEVLVRLAYTGVCHTDLHIWRGDIPGLLPLVGGHEGTGYVAAIGKHTHTHLKIGDPVGVKWLAKSCLGCEDCRKGHESTCAEQQVHGFTIDGSFQQWCVSYADHLTPIPAEVELAEAAPVLCAGVTVYHALKKVDGSCGETVVVTGAGGGLGHMACQYARSMGFRVIAVDSGEDKKKLVESYGVAEFIDYKEESDVVAKVKELTNGRGAHVVLVATGGGDPYNGVQNFLRSNGTVLVVGAPDVPFMQMDVHQAIQGEQRILGSMVGNRQDAVEALSLIASGDVHTTYTVEKLENLASVFERMEQRKLVGRVVLDCE